ncbi:MAG: ROK family transcriptional regulator [Chloroflexi bacterium]|nr:MAG: ROK family transcriptional regulator [Chloroflexota bacterium]
MINHRTLSGSNSATIKSHNLQTILKALLRHEHISRAHLAQLTGLSNTTITNQIAALLEQGIVEEGGTARLQQRPGAGRPRMALRLVPDARYAVGIHIGVGQIRVALTNLRANIIASHSFTHPLDKSANDVLDQAVMQLHNLIEQHGIDTGNIIGVGVGASGLVDPETGVNVMAPNLGWNNIPVKDYLRQRLNRPVTVDNNVRAMALGEALFGAAKNVRTLAFVYARYGVGAGFVVDEQLYRGSGAGAGEIGHTTITLEGGELCRCGNRGCLEPLVSEPSIMAQAQEMARKYSHGLLAHHLNSVETPTIEQVFAAARAGDAAVQTMLTERARYMGIALANLVNILNPELILLGGIFCQGHDLLLPTVEQVMRQRSFGNLGERVEIKATEFTTQAGIIGGAALALDRFFYRQETTF